ncbi:unnamed protein product [Ectocarpus sp. 4 AP-2014]
MPACTLVKTCRRRLDRGLAGRTWLCGGSKRRHPWRKLLLLEAIAPIHMAWAECVCWTLDRSESICLRDLSEGYALFIPLSPSSLGRQIPDDISLRPGLIMMRGLSTTAYAFT